jgi:hypothetical protein
VQLLLPRRARYGITPTGIVKTACKNGRFRLRAIALQRVTRRKQNAAGLELQYLLPQRKGPNDLQKPEKRAPTLPMFMTSLFFFSAPLLKQLPERFP